jgi:hypothetical protein
MVTIQQILNAHLDGLLARRTLSAPQLRAARALSVCRTAKLGGHVQRCPNGHIERVWYNSCRHRACPQCNGLAKERWLERTRARLIDCAHWHVVFTIPHELNVLWMLNTDALMSALFAAGLAPLTVNAEPGSDWKVGDTARSVLLSCAQAARPRSVSTPFCTA